MSHSVVNDQYDNNLHIQKPGKKNKSESTNPVAYQRFLNCDVKGFNLNLLIFRFFAHWSKLV